VYKYAQSQADYTLVASLDKEEYNDADLLTITVPLSLPYLNNQQDFERVDGEITVEGKIYKYVKRKIIDGNLVLLCVPHHAKMQLESAKEDFFKYSNDLVQNKHSKKSDRSKEAGFKKLLSEYDSNTDEFTAPIYSEQLVYAQEKQGAELYTFPHNSPEQPPELI
jgi:hypothetical protein